MPITSEQQKFVARKARKFQSQNNKLALPALEIAYLFLGIAHAPREVIIGKMLPDVRAVLAKLDKCKDDVKSYGTGAGEYYDDLCLARFLEGVCLRYVAYPVRLSVSLCQVEFPPTFWMFFCRILMPCQSRKRL